jgi:long-chain fatty acid transport protein
LEWRGFNPELDTTGLRPNDPVEAQKIRDTQRINALIPKAKRVGDAKGLTLGVAGPVTSHLGVGMALYLPRGALLRERFHPPDVPFFLDYDSRPQRLVVLVGAGYRAERHLSLGAGLSVIAHTKGDVRAGVPLGDPNAEVEIATDLDLVAALSVNAGVLYRPVMCLTLGLTYRGQLSLDVVSVQDVRTVIVTGLLPPFEIELPMRMEAITQFSPRQVAFGIAGEPLEGWTLIGDVVYINWSAYRPPFPKIEIDYSYLSGITIDKPYIPPVPDVGFKDTLVPKIGVEYHLDRRVTVRAGYAFEPSPVPEQTGETNILDGDKQVVSAGWGIILNRGARVIRIDTHLQGIFGEEGTFAKDPNRLRDEDPKRTGLQTKNPGYPGMRAESRTFGGGITVTAAL